jgi:hypothetical protein
MPRRLPIVLAVCLVSGCSALLPRSQESTSSPWTTYEEAQKSFDRLVPGETTVVQLKDMALDPSTNPNVTILNYTDVLRRFLLSQSISLNDLDEGVRLCVTAKTSCRGFEINQKVLNKQRTGYFLLDLLGFKRDTHTKGWAFSGLILLKDDVVIYKLTGGQPSIVGQESTQNPLGPLQMITSKMYGVTF